MPNQTYPMHVEFRRDERPPEPAEEILNWSVQVSLDHQLTLGELREALERIVDPGAPANASVQVNGNQVLVWRRRTLDKEEVSV